MSDSETADNFNRGVTKCIEQTCSEQQSVIRLLQAIISDYEQHGRVTKAWGELKAENERYKEALEVIAHHACGDCNTDKLGSEFCNGCEVGIAKQALKETQ